MWHLPTKPQTWQLPMWQLPIKPHPLVGDLCAACDVPVHQKQPFVLYGYRPDPQSTSALLRTIFTLHNETGNIWTHLAGFAYFNSVAAHHFLAYLEGGEWERLLLIFLVLSTAFCLISSTSYHVCTCTSHSVSTCMHRLDQAGIVSLISISYFTGIALVYKCYWSLRQFYLAYSVVVTLLLATPLIRPTLVQNMTRHMIICVVLGLVPTVHFVCISSREAIFTIVPDVLLTFLCYGVGAIFFVLRWPERTWPGRFDYVGQSHQIWHIFVVVAASCFVRGMSKTLASPALACAAAPTWQTLAATAAPSAAAAVNTSAPAAAVVA